MQQPLHVVVSVPAPAAAAAYLHYIHGLGRRACLGAGLSQGRIHAAAAGVPAPARRAGCRAGPGRGLGGVGGCGTQQEALQLIGSRPRNSRFSIFYKSEGDVHRLGTLGIQDSCLRSSALRRASLHLYRQHFSSMICSRDTMSVPYQP